MRLNKYQKAWINKLISGTTRKAKGRLFKSNRACCLGVGLQVCGVDKKSDHIEDGSLIDCRLTTDALKINYEGTINLNLVSKKWKKQILEETDFSDSDGLSLAALNDYSNWSHVKIGQFINENRKAVFNEST